ncbi:hypothetical protein HHK36_025692 [Tetracentron sinense]|uniref:Btz domain-containing protein n=1 Tax=Tetracentron sinense TaxID=13715 RepID=A0A834YI45_TETSI|nr:hypothetical protein HHK36_025692 [Tetracentron sinense]
MGTLVHRRRTPGGRKLWESKDDCKWGHDKFEAMTLQEARYEEERRAPKGHYRGRSKNRGIDHGYVRGNRSRAYSNSNNQNHASKGVRGRGPRRSGKSLETTSNISSGRVSKYTSTVQSDLVPPRKHAFASSLSSASPPFYPSGSSNQDISVTQKRDVQAGSTNRNLPSSGLMEEKLSTSHSNALLRGKIVADSFGQGKLYIDESNRPLAGKSLTNLHLQSSGSSSINTTQSSQSRAQGRGLSLSGQLTRPIPSVNQVNRVSQTQLPALQQRSVQIPVQPSLRFSSQQLGQHPGGSQASPPKASSTNSSEPGETESPPGSSKSNGALVGKGKASAQGSGRGSFLYSGAQVIGAMGNMGVAHGDQNFPPLLQVMQFGGQRPGGLGVPAVGMALPGYVAQPQGFGNSEMTWYINFLIIKQLDSEALAVLVSHLVRRSPVLSRPWTDRIFMAEDWVNMQRKGKEDSVVVALEEVIE